MKHVVHVCRTHVEPSAHFFMLTDARFIEAESIHYTAKLESIGLVKPFVL